MLYIFVTIGFLIIHSYLYKKNKNKRKKSLTYKIIRFITKILYFIT